MPVAKPYERRFFKYFRVDTPDKCWPWLGAYQAFGYGRLGIRTGYTEGAHRVSYELHHGPIPDGMMVLHSCDNPACVNPAHLRVGTRQENMDDMVARQRHLDGNRRHANKQRQRPVCKNGHVYADTGFRLIVGNGKVVRRCRACERDWAKVHQRKKAAA